MKTTFLKSPRTKPVSSHKLVAFLLAASMFPLWTPAAILADSFDQDDISMSADQEMIDVYRLYNSNTGEHFYTADLEEIDTLLNIGWIYEGLGWRGFTTGDPIYRLYNPNADGGDHYYTASIEEASALKNLGWIFDNDGNPLFYSGGNVNLYVTYNPNAKSGSHHYTTDVEEYNGLLDLGWTNGAIAWKVAERGDLEEVDLSILPSPDHYIIERIGKVYHRPTCLKVRKLWSPFRKVTDLTAEELLDQGYIPCSLCRP